MKVLSKEKEAQRKDHIVDLYQRVEYYSKNPSNNALNEDAEVEELIDKLLELEHEITVDLPQRDGSWDAFKTWLTTQGQLPMDKFEIKKLAGQEYGLYANAEFKENDLIVEIPRKLFMTNDTAMADSKLASFVQDPICQHMQNLVLTLHLMAEYCKPNSFWAPYMKSLPSTYSTILYMKTPELNQLRGSPTLEEVVKFKRNIARQYAYFWMKLHSEPRFKTLFSCFTYEFYRWALSTVMTRQNVVPAKGGKKEETTYALIPFWDLCNHKHGKMTTDFDTKKDCLVFYSMAHVKPKQEIFNYYGNRNNGDFFLYNGFVYADHKDDFVKIRIGISKADPAYALKSALCEKIGLQVNGLYEIKAKSVKINEKVLAIVRIFLMEKEQLEKWVRAKNADELFNPQCKDLEYLNTKVGEFLALRCSLLLKKYPAIDKYMNENIGKIVKAEKKILQSFA